MSPSLLLIKKTRDLVGFVVHLPESMGRESLSTYVFESNWEDEKICYAINLGKEIIEVQNRSKRTHLEAYIDK